MNAYRLARGTVECDDDGLFVGGVALFRRGGESAGFEFRLIDAFHEDLRRRNGAAIDAASGLGGLKFVA
jgi:hypothetical protein